MRQQMFAQPLSSNNSCAIRLVVDAATDVRPATEQQQ
jgi:hypothetical protein